MKAIETEYKGHTFRSRLEARYAVLFDSMGLEWKYEMQGYELHDGRKYLPDFYLPELDLYVEVKGGSASREAKNKLHHFAHPIILLENLPDPDLPPMSGLGGHLYVHDVCDSGGGQYDCEAHIISCVKCRKWVVDIRNNDSRLFDRDRILVDAGNGWHKWGPHCQHGYHAGWRAEGGVEEAIKDARSARFEHGEYGATR